MTAYPARTTLKKPLPKTKRPVAPVGYRVMEISSDSATQRVRELISLLRMVDLEGETAKANEYSMDDNNGGRIFF